MSLVEMAQLLRERQPLLVADARLVWPPEAPQRKCCMNAAAHARIVGTEGEMVRAVPHRVVECPAPLAAGEGLPVLALGAEPDPLDVEGLQQEVRVALPLGRGHQLLA